MRLEIFTRQVMFNGPLPTPRLELWTAWLAQHGISTADIPVDAFVRVDDQEQSITYLANARSLDGRLTISGNCVVHEHRTIHIGEPIAPFPPPSDLTS